jgi:hypothetical protein
LALAAGTDAGVAQLDRASVYGTDFPNPQGQQESSLTQSHAGSDSAPDSAQVSKPAISGQQLPTPTAPATDPDLAAIASAWPSLPAALKAGIVAMVKASAPAGDAGDSGKPGNP